MMSLVYARLPRIRVVFFFVLFFLRDGRVRSEAVPSEQDDDAATIEYLLRGSLQHHDPVERIIDMGALKDLNGADPAANELVFHPPGHEANVLDYPYFGHWQHAMCGASVVHDDILITAGHCGRKATEPHWRKQVRLLSKYREEGGILRNIAHLEVHPDWFQPKQVYDFQLIKTQKSVLVDDDGNPTGVQVVELNKDVNNPAPGDPIQAVGFGTVTPDASTGNSLVLMDATLQSFGIDHCSHQYGKGKINGDAMLCIGTIDGTKDTCQGDSGGPYLSDKDVLVGVVSWGEGCAEKDHAGLGSRVSAVTAWIEKEICRLSAMPPSSCNNGTTTSKDNQLPSSQEAGGFNVRITVQHDDAPKETSWSFTHRESTSLLYFQPFESVPQPFVDVSRVFHDLKAGTYVFAISDTKKDGLCCEFGKGSIAITHHQTNQVLWQHNGEFEEFLSVTLELDSGGSVINSKVDQAWINPSVAISDSNGNSGSLSEDEWVVFPWER